MSICTKCVLPDTYPGIEFDQHGVCNYCNNYVHADVMKNHFNNEEDLIDCLQKYKRLNNKYDVLVPLSGGVDSSNALIEIVQKYSLNPLCFHNDNGYEDMTATNNVRNLCKKLDADLIIVQQDLPFMRKMWKYIHEASVYGLTSCYVCGNILYLNALEIADHYGIKLIINGYSKGQVGITSKQEDGIGMLRHMQNIIRERKDKEFYNKFMDKYKVLTKSITYSSIADLKNEVSNDKMLVIPFYIFNFYKTDKEMLKHKIRKVFEWQSIDNSYPKRTTNCMMNWLGTFIDRKKMGYSVYETEYAQLVRAGDMSREQALNDLEFNPPNDLLDKLSRDLDIDYSRIKSIVND